MYDVEKTHNLRTVYGVLYVKEILDLFRRTGESLYELDVYIGLLHERRINTHINGDGRVVSNINSIGG